MRGVGGTGGRNDDSCVNPTLFKVIQELYS
jgi:hypothetical protein